MRLNRTQLKISAALITATVALYVVRWALFPGYALHNEMWRFLVGDLGFLFLQIVLVTMLIDQVIQQREREEMKVKLNMVIGAFFSEVGSTLLSGIATLDTRLCDVRGRLVPALDWKPADYAAAKTTLAAHDADIVLPSAPELIALRDFLHAEKPFMLGLLSNQSLLEHETFTQLLWAVTHFAEELRARPDLAALPDADAAHLAGDARRVYTLLISEWLDYMSHLQSQYPYLFSLAARTNPFDAVACATIEG